MWNVVSSVVLHSKDSNIHVTDLVFKVQRPAARKKKYKLRVKVKREEESRVACAISISCSAVTAKPGSPCQ